jgi:hypothetical protein
VQDKIKHEGNAALFKYMETTLTNQKWVREDIVSSLNLGNACYHVVHNRLSHRLLSKNRKINVRGESKKFGEWYQKTNKTEDTNKLTLLVLKEIAILHNTLLAKFIKFLETVSKGFFRNRSQNRCH